MPNLAIAAAAIVDARLKLAEARIGVDKKHWGIVRIPRRLCDWQSPANQSRSTMQGGEHGSLDIRMMEQCIALSRTARLHGEFPFSCVICSGGDVLVESLNRVTRDRDVTRHAELVAISAAQKEVGSLRLSRCTLYSNVEPCAMCSMAIRETGISRVVFAIASPIMGGASRWDVLADAQLARTMPLFFRKSPEVVSGLLAREAEQAWSDWHPLLWKIIKRRGCFGEPGVPAGPGSPEGPRGTSRRTR
jgi:tRNA(adenine34) deaminase